jgi:hypothetical protein
MIVIPVALYSIYLGIHHGIYVQNCENRFLVQIFDGHNRFSHVKQYKIECDKCSKYTLDHDVSFGPIRCKLLFKVVHFIADSNKGCA